MLNSIKNANEHTSGVYMIYCVLNKKAYIGESVNIYRRFTEHRANLKAFSADEPPEKVANKPGPEFREDCKKYGKRFFLFLTLEYCEKSKLKEREAFYIRSVERSQLYNQIDFWVGRKHNEETRRKISIKNKGKSHLVTLETRNKVNFNPSRAKLTKEGVFEIKKRILAKTPIIVLAHEFKVDFCTILDIAAGRGWKYVSHIDGAYTFPIKDDFEKVCKFATWPKIDTLKVAQTKLLPKYLAGSL